MFLVRYQIKHDKPRYLAEFRLFGRRNRIRLTDRKSEAITYPVRTQAVSVKDDAALLTLYACDAVGSCPVGHWDVVPAG